MAKAEHDNADDPSRQAGQAGQAGAEQTPVESDSAAVPSAPSAQGDRSTSPADSPAKDTASGPVSGPATEPASRQQPANGDQDQAGRPDGDNLAETASEASEASEASGTDNPTETASETDQADESSRPPAGQPAAASTPPPAQPASASTPPPAAIGGETRELTARAPVVRAMLVMNLLLLAAMVALIIYMLRSGTPSPAAAVQAPTSLPSADQAKEQKGQGVRPRPTWAEGGATPQDASAADSGNQAGPAPLSWNEAEKLLFAGQYRQALAGYRRLLTDTESIPGNELLSDLLRLRSAQCLAHIGRTREAQQAYLRAAASKSPVVRAVANYYLAAGDVLGGQFLHGRMRAYMAIAAITKLDVPLSLEADCDFLIARAMTQKILSQGQVDGAVQWGGIETTDPFVGLGESDLRRLLREGIEARNQAVLGPEVKRVDSRAGGRQYNVTAEKASIDKLLASLAEQAGVDLKWEAVSPAARRRTISLDCAGISDQRLAEVACGAVGLLARFTGQEIVVHDPQQYEILSRRQALLAREAASAWRRMFLRSPDDSRAGLGHFALAALEESSGQMADAMRDYQLVAERFRKQDVAPAAMLRLARMKIALRDYSGARLDLLSLLDRYPDYVSSEKVYLYLGDATRKAGLLDDAIRVFRKLYYLNPTRQCQYLASLGAARCYQQKGDPDETKKWATRYIGLVDPGNEGLAEAYMLIGSSEASLDNFAEAAKSFKLALRSRPSADLRADASLALADAEAQSEHFVEAITVLQRMRDGQASPQQRYRYLLKLAKIYRMIGLPGQGATVLRTGLGTISDPQKQASLKVQLARCYADGGDLQLAANLLGKVLLEMDSGRGAQQAACYLAEIYLKLGKTGQAIDLATELLKSPGQPGIRARAQNVLGSARVAQHQYDQAAMAFSGLLFKQEDKKE